MKASAKLMALLMALVMVFSLAACTNSAGKESGSAESPSADSSSTPGETYLVGIVQHAPHDALDAATRGFKDALTEELGSAVSFKEGNASNESSNNSIIVDGFLSEGVDLILANATDSLTAASSATSEIPILGTSITNYGVALNLGTTEDKVLGGNISGTSDLAPLDQQAAMIQELFPDAKNIGLLYCSAEANSIFQVEAVKGYLTDMGYTCAQYAFTDVNDLPSVTQTAVDNSDVIYIPTDNTAANNTEAIANVVLPAKVPVVAGEAGIVKGCGVATLSISYYELGQITGRMAAQILTGQAKVSDLAIAYDTTLDKLYNAANCEALGIAVPEGYQPIEEVQ